MCLALLLCALPIAWAQDQVSEDEIKLQEAFLAASKERILGNYEEAASLYEALMKKDRQNDVIAFELGRVYDHLEEPEKAIENFEKAIKLQPENEWYKKYLADVYQKLGLDLKAASIYKELVSKNPRNDFYYFKWAYFLVRANKINEALDVYVALEKEMGISEELVRRKHSLYLGLGKYSKAANELERLIDAFPDRVEYYHLLASFYEQIDERKKAVKIYKDILKIYPDDPKAQMALVNDSAPKNDEIEYLKSLQPIFEKNDLSIDLKIARILPLIQEVASSGNVQLADELLQLTNILERVHPNEAKAFSAAGDILYHTNRLDEAIQKYEKTIALDDTVYSVWEQLLYAYLENKQYDQLVESSEEAMDYFPNKASAYYLNGLANIKKGKYKDALSALEQALLMSGKDGFMQFQVLGNLGKVYHELKDGGQSNAAFEKALQLNAKSPQVLSAYSISLADRGENLEKAEEMAKTANTILPNNAQTAHARGWVFYKKKQYEQSKEWFDKALAVGGNEDADILEHYGDLLFQIEMPDQAIEYWTKALNKGNHSELLKKKIADRKLYE